MRCADLIYPNSEAWLQADRKRLLLFGMSGLGKTYLSNMLRDDGGWFHYSVDYRIGTRYMGELITDSFKREAMRVPYLANLLRSDSIYIGSNITFENLAPLSTYLGKPGDPEKGGLSLEEYRKRQEAHRQAEIASLLDATRFIERAEEIYGYRDFVCDSGGSICEVVDPRDPADRVMRALSGSMLMVWIKGTAAHRQELIRRFNRAPKPMYYRPEFLSEAWAEYTRSHNLLDDDVDPDDFVRFTYGKAVATRFPRYRDMARHWGVTVTAEEVSAVRSPDAFTALIAHAIDRGGSAEDPALEMDAA